METRPADPSGHTYVSDSDGSVPADSVVVEWRMNLNDGSVPASSYREVFRVGINQYDHPIKQLAFNPYSVPGDPDYGLLYVAHGDGSIFSAPGSGGHGNDALGKILRINPLAGPGAEPYTIPADNPFVGDPGMLDEVYSIGHRNPHNLAFGRDDLGRARLVVGEAGRDNAEEVNLVEAGADFGWPEREGTFVHVAAQSGLDIGVEPLPADDWKRGYTYPAAQLLHTGAPGDSPTGEAVAGGYLVDNGSPLTGLYLFTDFVLTGTTYAAEMHQLVAANTNLAPGDAPSALTQAPALELSIWFDHDDDPSTPPLPRAHLRDVLDDEARYDGSGRADIRFGQGPDGTVFILNKRNGHIYRIANSVPPAPAGPAGSCPTAFDFALDGAGMLITTESGRVTAIGSAPTPAAAPSLAPGETVTGIIAAEEVDGYHLVTDLGRVIERGDAIAIQGIEHLNLQGPVLDATRGGGGLYLVGSDGGVFALGGAPFRGSAGDLVLNAPIRALMATSTGYRFAAEDGGVFAYASSFRGSMGGVVLNQPVAGIDGTDGGYWLAALDGGVFAFGVPYFGSLGAVPGTRLQDFASVRDAGYSMLTDTGVVHHFGLPARWYGAATHVGSC